jgi:hypothetical protein
MKPLLATHMLARPHGCKWVCHAVVPLTTPERYGLQGIIIIIIIISPHPRKSTTLV